MITPKAKIIAIGAALAGLSGVFALMLTEVQGLMRWVEIPLVEAMDKFWARHFDVGISRALLLGLFTAPYLIYIFKKGVRIDKQIGIAILWITAMVLSWTSAIFIGAPDFAGGGPSTQAVFTGLLLAGAVGAIIVSLGFHFLFKRLDVGQHVHIALTGFVAGGALLFLTIFGILVGWPLVVFAVLLYKAVPGELPKQFPKYVFRTLAVVVVIAVLVGVGERLLPKVNIFFEEHFGTKVDVTDFAECAEKYPDQVVRYPAHPGEEFCSTGREMFKRSVGGRDN